LIEIPEAAALAKQINGILAGRTIISATANQSPHKFAWFCGEPGEYNNILAGRKISKAAAYGGLVELRAGTAAIVVGDGVNLRYHKPSDKRPLKHQLLVELDDGAAVTASVQMYGGIWCFNEGEFKYPYYQVALEKPSVFSEAFDREYFNRILAAPDMQKLSLKALLATEQRIPGLGNGVLQDILWSAKLHPKRKLGSLSEEEINSLFAELKRVLSKMTELGGRDTEKDLLGNAGGYRTVMSKNNSDGICPDCGEPIIKENYLGGSIYYCRRCQQI
jgi:formamidopyrimidine-DNA glycosylase